MSALVLGLALLAGESDPDPFAHVINLLYNPGFLPRAELPHDAYAGPAPPLARAEFSPGWFPEGATAAALDAAAAADPPYSLRFDAPARGAVPASVPEEEEKRREKPAQGNTCVGPLAEYRKGLGAVEGLGSGNGFDETEDFVLLQGAAEGVKPRVYPPFARRKVVGEDGDLHRGRPLPLSPAEDRKSQRGNAQRLDQRPFERHRRVGGEDAAESEGTDLLEAASREEGDTPFPPEEEGGAHPRYPVSVTAVVARPSDVFGGQQRLRAPRRRRFPSRWSRSGRGRRNGSAHQPSTDLSTRDT